MDNERTSTMSRLRLPLQSAPVQRTTRVSRGMTGEGVVPAVAGWQHVACGVAAGLAGIIGGHFGAGAVHGICEALAAAGD